MHIYHSQSEAWREIEDVLGSLAKPALITIAGSTCSGKSTMAARMCSQVMSALVELDDYFRDLEDPLLPRDAGGKLVFDRPDSYDCGEYVGHIKALLAGRSIRLPQYDKQTNRRLPVRKTVISSSIIVTEGLFSISLLDDVHPACACLKIYLDVSLDICLARRIERDTNAFNVSAEKVRNFFNQRVRPYIEEFVLPQRQQADLVIAG
jgi:uridine kinase